LFNFPFQPIEGLSDPDNFLKVQLRCTFKKLSEFYGSAKRCIQNSFYFVTYLQGKISAVKTMIPSAYYFDLRIFTHATS